MSVGTAAPAAKPKLFAEGGGSWSQFVWTKTGDLIFVDDRRGYSFLGRYRPGAKTVDWLVTGVDRLAVVPCTIFRGRVLHGLTPTRGNHECMGRPCSLNLVNLVIIAA